MEKGNKTLVTLVSVFVVLILAVAFLSSLSDSTLVNTQRTAVSSEAHALTIDADTSINTTTEYTVTNNPTGWKVQDCPLTSFSLTNQSGTALTLTTDYTVNLSTGVYTLKNTTTTVGLIGAYNNSYATYQYCGSNYVSSSWGRSILNTNVGLFAVAILIAIVLVVYVLLGKKEDN